MTVAVAALLGIGLGPAGALAALPSAQVGDLVVVPVTGAYTYSMSNNYNVAFRPPIVLCRNGTARLAVRRETLGDLLAREVLLSTP